MLIPLGNSKQSFRESLTFISCRLVTTAMMIIIIVEMLGKAEQMDRMCYYFCRY